MNRVRVSFGSALAFRSKWVFSQTFYVILFCVGMGSFFIHELAHYLAGVALGHDMAASPNHVWPRDFVSAGDQAMISAAGPVVTIVQGAVGFWLVMRRYPLFGYALLYMAFFMRLLATAFSAFNPNDEAKVSQLLGLGTWTLPLAVVVALLLLLLVASRELKLGFRDQSVCFLVASAVFSLVIGLDVTFWPKA